MWARFARLRLKVQYLNVLVIVGVYIALRLAFYREGDNCLSLIKRWGTESLVDRNGFDFFIVSFVSPFNKP